MQLIGCDSVRVLALLFVTASISPAQDKPNALLGEGKPWGTPIYVNDTGVEGPTVIVTGGIHGNEPSGAVSAEQIRHWPIARGKLIVIPRVNTAGLDASIRYIPKATEVQKDLNRNFPSPGITDEPRGEIATALWKFVVAQNPDWLFDLHEGYEFNISHKPKPGKTKSVGSSIIYDRTQQLEPMVERMLTVANGTVSNPDRMFVLRGRGPKKTGLASAVIHVLKKQAMILETTYQHQRLPVRTRQHRAMMGVALRQIGMIDKDLMDVVTPSRASRGPEICVALFDDEGGSEKGVSTLTPLLNASSGISMTHVDAMDVRPDFLRQFDVIIFGGGSGSEQAKTLGAKGAAAVRAFVKDGGGYIGICGGAFLCSAHYSWSLKLVDTDVFTGTREVEGLGRKAMYLRGPNAQVKMQLTDVGKRVFSGVSEHSKVDFHNGPIISPMKFDGLPEYIPLAYFRSEQVLYPPQKGTMIDSPAIVMGTLGKGRVISISPHPERSPGLESMIAQSVQAVANLKNQDVVNALVGEASRNSTEASLSKIKNYVAPTLSDVSYGDHKRQVLDFWQAKSEKPTPVVFVIHGGSWTSGSKIRIFNYLNVSRLLEDGCSVVSINYRYVTQAPKDTEEPPVRTPLYDAARALQFVRSKARDWNIDKTRIGASGASAGACTSLWLAYHDDLADPDSDDPIARESTRLACVAVSGAQTTLDPKQMKEWTPNSRYGGHAFGFGKFDEFLTKRESILPWIKEYSPYANLTDDDPPVALFYKHAPAIGKPAKDPTHTGNFGVKLQEHCKAVGTECFLSYTGLKNRKYTSKTSYLIERLHAK